jgi:hypothetical protein
MTMPMLTITMPIAKIMLMHTIKTTAKIMLQLITKTMSTVRITHTHTVRITPIQKIMLMATTIIAKITQTTILTTMKGITHITKITPMLTMPMHMPKTMPTLLMPTKMFTHTLTTTTTVKVQTISRIAGLLQLSP